VYRPGSSGVHINNARLLKHGSVCFTKALWRVRGIHLGKVRPRDKGGGEGGLRIGSGAG